MSYHGQTSESFSADAIRRFLLGQVRADVRDRFEERLFSDDELETSVHLAEIELADDYASARLSDHERELFRQRFLLTVDRQQQLRVSTAIHDRFASAPSMKTRPVIVPNLRTIFDFRRSVWRYAFAALILLFVLATVLLVTKEPQVVKRLAPSREAPKPSITPTPVETHHAITSSSPAHVEQSPALPTHEAPALTVALVATTAADQSPVITLPPKESDLVRLELSIEQNRRTSYRAELLTDAGELLLSAESLKGSDAKPGTVDFDVSAKVLKAGNYQVKLTSLDDATVAPAIYHFRVQ